MYYNNTHTWHSPHHTLHPPPPHTLPPPSPLPNRMQGRMSRTSASLPPYPRPASLASSSFSSSAPVSSHCCLVVHKKDVECFSDWVNNGLPNIEGKLTRAQQDIIAEFVPHLILFMRRAEAQNEDPQEALIEALKSIDPITSIFDMIKGPLEFYVNQLLYSADYFSHPAFLIVRIDTAVVEFNHFKWNRILGFEDTNYFLERVVSMFLYFVHPNDVDFIEAADHLSSQRTDPKGRTVLILFQLEVPERIMRETETGGVATVTMRTHAKYPNGEVKPVLLRVTVTRDQDYWYVWTVTRLDQINPITYSTAADI